MLLLERIHPVVCVDRYRAVHGVGDNHVAIPLTRIYKTSKEKTGSGNRDTGRTGISNAQKEGLNHATVKTELHIDTRRR